MDLSYYAGVYSLLIQKDFGAAIQQLTCALGFRDDVPRLLVIAYCGAGNTDAARDIIRDQDIPEASLPVGVFSRLQLSDT
jgi:hypothetical protein